MPVAGLSAVNLGGTKSIVARARPLAVDARRPARERHRRRAGVRRARHAPDDHVGVVAFGRSAVALTGSAATPGRRPRPARRITVDSKSGTALYDAITVSADRLRARRAARPRDRRHDRRQGRLEPAFVPRRRQRRAQRARRRLHDRHRRPGLHVGGAARARAARPAARITKASSAHDLAATYAAVQAELARTWQLSYLTSARPGSTVSLTAIVPASAASASSSTLPDDGSSAVDAPVRPDPQLRVHRRGHGRARSRSSAALILLATLLLVRVAPVEPAAHAHRATPGRRRRQREAAPAAGPRGDPCQARRLDRERVQERRASSSRSQRMIERADLPLRPGELARDLRRRRARPRPVRRCRRPVVADDARR